MGLGLSVWGLGSGEGLEVGVRANQTKKAEPPSSRCGLLGFGEQGLKVLGCNQDLGM